MAVLDIAVKPLCSWSDTMEMGMQIESVADGGEGGHWSWEECLLTQL